MGSIFTLLFLLSSTTHVVFGIYEDLIGKFDWKQSYLGEVKHASFDSVKRLVVATEENVLASLNLKNGNIHWRHVLEDPADNQIVLLHVDKEIATVSGGTKGFYVRGWELNSGTLLWEWALYPETASNSYWIVNNEQLVHIGREVSSHLQVTVYDLSTGRNSGKTTQISTPWITDLAHCVIAGTHYVCLSDSQLYYIDVVASENKVYSFAVQTLIGDAPGKVVLKSAEYSEPSVLLVRNNVARFLKLKAGIPEVLPYSLTPNVMVAPNGDQALLLQIVSGNEGQVQVRSKHLQEGSEEIIDLQYTNESGIKKVLAALCRGSACRMVILNNDHSISLTQLPAGKVLWTREEALSHIVAAEFMELPVSDMDASIEHEFDAADPIGMLYHRLSSQIRQLTVLLSPSKDASSSQLVRDEFGLHKLIVAVTKVGKVFALDTLSGDVVWSKFLPDVKPFVVLQKPTALLLLQRTARYAPLPPVCSLLLKDGTTGNGVLYSFDPITGVSREGTQRLPYRIDQAMLLPYEDDNHLKGLLIYSEQGGVTLHPPTTKSVLLDHLNSVYLYTVHPEEGILKGLSLIHSSSTNLKATPTWEINLGANTQLIELSVRPAAERVHSQGRVLADRSVLYKYVNPNLLAVATLVEDPLHKRVLSVYLIDGVTGLIAYSAYHKRVGHPIHLVHSENWLLYSYFNERFRRVEFGAVELYEGTTQSNSTVFSSLAISQLPHAESQAYIFPAQPVSMKVTHTERGITSKHVLVALSNGAVIEVPWMFLEPRGDFVSGNPEDGYIPYVPELPLPSDAAINYNQTLERTRGLVVAPARLESTCLVLVHGLDLFYTRVTPSKTFDLLKEDFDHWLIVVVLTGLLVASYVSKRLASRKALKQAWK